MGTQNTLQRRIGEELKACAKVAFESLTGIYQKPKGKRRVLYSRAKLEQCTHCHHWYPWYALTIDEDAQTVCLECASTIDRW
ncbi:MAG TPA: hypothetical protein VEL31_12240 [Ktedonobacteraceae bacterium]|nr:hypothetical protein [Ktedonobacteraceae bacterium]